MSNRAVLVIDIQNEYFSSASPGSKPPPRTPHVMPASVRQEFSDPNMPFFNPGSEGVKIHDSVTPENDEPAILKTYPNSFVKTELKALLDGAGVKEVVVVGAMSHMCIEAASRAASDLGYKVTVVHDACATRDLEFNGQIVPASAVDATAMAALASAYAAIESTARYLS